MLTSKVSAFIEAIESSGEVSRHQESQDTWLIHVFDGRRFEPPVVLVVKSDDLDARLTASMDDGSAVFPDVPPEIGARRLLLVHLSEALGQEPPPARVRVLPRKLEVHRSAPATVDSIEAAPPGGRRWTATPPPDERPTTDR